MVRNEKGWQVNVLICPECNSHEPNTAKFCGICGTPLTQEGRVAHFLGGMPEDNSAIDLPHHRRPIFYVVLALALVLLLAVLGGTGYLLFRAFESDNPAPATETTDTVTENSYRFEDADLGISFLYPRLWVLEERQETGKLLAMTVGITSTKFASFTATRLAPDVTVGGRDGIEAYVRTLLKDVLPAAPAGTAVPGGSTGTSANAASGNTAALERTEINGQFAFRIKYDQTSGDTRITVQRYFLAPSDVLFEFQFRAPAGEWSAVSPDFSLIIQSFQVNTDSG